MAGETGGEGDGRHPGGRCADVSIPGNQPIFESGTALDIPPPTMSQPRTIVPGATYLLTRRVLRRYFLLRPDSAITQLIIYTLTVTARRYGILVHALCVMSTHLHLVVTDTRGELPRFLQQFHRLVALGTKVLRAWEGGR